MYHIFILLEIYASYELYNGYNDQVIDLYTGLYRPVSYVNHEFGNIQSLFNVGNKLWKIHALYMIKHFNVYCFFSARIIF
ncbi:hypothetical protein [Ehrlichia ruminantium]|uniref:hypothetical protein n=1 Tax=Ehrlichia ruminantium TaxID=779 RepID=UPI001E4F0910|nr:hypothetical protein [Ehrlichia ruminantium]